MATDQRRYQVFVSSTYLDLREARQAVTAALLECDAFPAGMELFPAADDDAWTLIKKVIDESDYYMLIIAGKYGSVGDDGVGYTEKEYNYAVARGKPVMAFLHGNPDGLAVELSEKKEDMQAKLVAFREEVRLAKHVKFWTSEEQLAGQVALTYNKFIRLYPAVGWIRADRGTSTESLQALADARAEIDELRQQLGAVRTSAPQGSEDLAQGKDNVRLPLWAKGYYIGEDGFRHDVGKWTHVVTTWDTLFSAAAPRLLQECEESGLREALEVFLGNDFVLQAADALIERATENGVSVDRTSLRGVSIELHDDDFGTVLVQFMALGLIQRSTRKRSVSDTGTYWTLTPYGETRTIQLRALRKGTTVVLQGDSASDSDVSPTAATGQDSPGE